MRLLKAPARRILLVSAETTISWLSWSKPFFESATALIKTVCESGLVNPIKALGKFYRPLFMAKLFIQTLLTPSDNSNITSCTRLLHPGPTFIKWKSASWNNCYSCCHDDCIGSLRDPSFPGKKGVGCEIRPWRSLHTLRAGMKPSFNLIFE